MPHVVLERQENLFLLKLVNGARANTLTDEVLDQWHAALDEVEACKENVALVIVSEDAKYWSNGIDLEYIQSKGMEYLFTHFVHRVDALLMRIAMFNAPTVACLSGHTYGGGALIASACDFRTMRSDRGYFCFPEVDLKLAFSPVMLEMVKLLRNEQARWDLAMTGRAIGGEEAARRDVVDATWPAEDLLPKTLEMAAQLAKKDRKTYTAIKRMLRQHLKPLQSDAR